MNNKYVIFRLANIHLQHISLSDNFPESLNSIFCSVSRRSTMADSQNPLSIDRLLNGLVSVLFAFVYKVRKAEEKSTGSKVTCC